MCWDVFIGLIKIGIAYRGLGLEINALEYFEIVRTLENKC